MTVESFRAFADARIDIGNPGYRQPLTLRAGTFDPAIGPQCEVVLPGSVASGKVMSTCCSRFSDSKLLFPHHFVGRGDMSRED